MKRILRALNKEFTPMGMPYEFDIWQGTRRYPYFVGEISEIPTSDEDGKREFEFILTGEDRYDYNQLLMWSETLRKRYKYGHSIVVDGGLIKIIYNNTFSIPVEDEYFKRIQINITVYLWEV